jgi:transglutaminase-like putative cysteine protease
VNEYFMDSKTAGVFRTVFTMGFLFVLLSAGHAASSAGVAANKEYVSVVDTVTVNADGSNTAQKEAEIRLLDISGLDEVAQITFRFNDQRSSLDVLEAETIKADGKRIKVRADQIRLQEDPATTGVPMFSTSKMKTIIFPDVQVGDSVHYRIRETETEPDFPGQFSYLDGTDPDTQVRSFKLTITAPRSMKLQSGTSGYHETRTTGPLGEQIWSWTFSQPEARAFGYYKADVFLRGPHMVVTSFADWGAIAAAYRERAVDKTAIDPQLQALADKITGGITDRREQSKKIYDWVRGNIRYVALYLANGGYVPHSASSILRNRYGDCKDHVVLLEALLRAKGIESHGVLINSMDLFDAGTVPVPDIFDHIITYIPEFGLYADATGEYLPFGEIGYGLSSKQVLHLDKSMGLRRTPALRASANMQITGMQLDLHEDGTLKGEIDVASTGSVSLDWRYSIAGIGPLDRANIVHDGLAKNGFQGSGTFTADQPESDASPYRVKVDFTAEESAWDLSGPEAMELHVPVFDLYPLNSLTSFVDELPEAVYSRACMAIDTMDSYRVRLPASVQVAVLPKPVSLVEGPIRYESSYRNEGGEIIVSRHYVMSIDRGYCTPQDIAGMVVTAKTIRRDLHRKILLKPAGS